MLHIKLEMCPACGYVVCALCSIQVSLYFFSSRKHILVSKKYMLKAQNVRTNVHKEIMQAQRKSVTLEKNDIQVPLCTYVL